MVLVHDTSSQQMLYKCMKFGLISVTVIKLKSGHDFVTTYVTRGVI